MGDRDLLRQVQREPTQTGPKGTYSDRYKGDVLRRVQKGTCSDRYKGKLLRQVKRGPT